MNMKDPNQNIYNILVTRKLVRWGTSAEFTFCFIYKQILESRFHRGCK